MMCPSVTTDSLRGESPIFQQNWAHERATTAVAHLLKRSLHSYASHAVLTAPPPDRAAMSPMPGTHIRSSVVLKRPKVREPVSTPRADDR